MPQRIDLDKLAAPWRHHPIVHLRIHPGQLDAGRSGTQQAICRIDADAVAGAALVPADDIR